MVAGLELTRVTRSPSSLRMRQAWDKSAGDRADDPTVAAKNEYLDYTVIEFGSKAEISRSYNGVTATQLGGNTSLASHLARLGRSI